MFLLSLSSLWKNVNIWWNQMLHYPKWTNFMEQPNTLFSPSPDFCPDQECLKYPSSNPVITNSATRQVLQVSRKRDNRTHNKQVTQGIVNEQATLKWQSWQPPATHALEKTTQKYRAHSTPSWRLARPVLLVMWWRSKQTLDLSSVMIMSETLSDTFPSSGP